MPSSISPLPPSPSGQWPRIGSALPLLRDPTAFFDRCRRVLGDTFAIDVVGHTVLCLFSPEGVRNLWALPEREASKGLADFALLRHKVPDELFVGRRTRPHDLFSRDDTALQLANLDRAIAAAMDELGDAGEIELFEWTRRLSHRVGLASWGGIGPDTAALLDPVIRALDRLDSSESFVHPHRGLWVVLTSKRGERRALGELDAAYREIVAQRDAHASPQPDLFDRIRQAWDGAPSPARETGIGRDVVLVHMGSQSNLFAAMAWTIVHLLQRPELAERVRAGDEALLEACAHESIRLRQRSIVLRKTLAPVEIEDGKTRYRVAPGVFLATMMSCTNTSAAPGLDAFDPGNFPDSRFARRAELAAPELVTTFGHGHHRCPAMRFSVESICRVSAALLRRFDLEPRFRDPQPLRRQIGGVARADRPCRIRYRGSGQ